MLLYLIAGKIYLEKFANPKLEEAAECFTRAGCYEIAAQLYSQCNLFSKCLSVCSDAKLFDMGFQLLQYWKRNAFSNEVLLNSNAAIQMFLESAAHYYNGLHDNRTMMKFVKAFHSENSVRAFLNSLGFLDELLSLEREWGNHLEALKIARMIGDLLAEADLLEETGHYEDASLSILLHVFSNSLWAPRSEGWPLKQFPQKEELLTKAKAFAKNVSGHFFEFVCTEANILSGEECSMPELIQYFSSYRRHKSVRGEIICAQKVLDSHLDLSTSAYSWEDDVAGDLVRHAEDRLSQNQALVETLVYFWSFWKENIWNIFNLGCPGKEDVSGEFCLNYLAVKKLFTGTNVVYLLRYSDAYWLRKIDGQCFMKKGKLVTIGAHTFAQAARGYWCSEIFCVSMRVLEKLKALYEFATKNPLSLYCQTIPAVHMFVVTKFLMETRFLNYKHHIDTLKIFLELSTNSFLDNLYPLDWQKLLTENMIFLREMQHSKRVLQEVIISTISSTSNLTSGQIAKVTTATFGSGELSSEQYIKIAEKFGRDSPWGECFHKLGVNMQSVVPPVSAHNNLNAAQREVYLVHKFHKALEDTYNADWENDNDYISPSCFLYLVDRLLIRVSNLRGFFFTSRASFVEWLIHQEWKANPNIKAVADFKSSLIVVLDFVSYVVEQLLYHEQDTIHWFGKAKINSDCYPLLVLRLFVVTCVLCLNHGKYFDLLCHLLGRSEITSHLPKDFYECLRRLLENDSEEMSVYAIAEAFKKIGNPLVVVSSGEHCSNITCPDAIFVNLDVNKGRDNIIKILFPNDVKDSPNQIGGNEIETIASGDKDLKTQNQVEGDPQRNC